MVLVAVHQLEAERRERGGGHGCWNSLKIAQKFFSLILRLAGKRDAAPGHHPSPLSGFARRGHARFRVRSGEDYPANLLLSEAGPYQSTAALSRNADTGKCSTQPCIDDELSGAHHDRIACDRKAQRCLRAAKAWINHLGF